MSGRAAGMGPSAEEAEVGSAGDSVHQLPSPPGGTGFQPQSSLPLRKVSVPEKGGQYPGDRPSPLRRTVSEQQPHSPAVRMPLHVGVLHYSPGYDVFPLLAEPSR